LIGRFAFAELWGLADGLIELFDNFALLVNQQL
jgi:hypothetical protein